MDPPPGYYYEILAPNNISKARWQRSYPGCFGFVFVLWEEAETRLPSLFVLMVGTRCRVHGKQGFFLTEFVQNTDVLISFSV